MAMMTSIHSIARHNNTISISKVNFIGFAGTRRFSVLWLKWRKARVLLGQARTALESPHARHQITFCNRKSQDIVAVFQDLMMS
jgi:hypothetical protein